MVAVTYSAKRSISSGHVIGTQYSLDLPAIVLNPKKTLETSESISISGKVQNVISRNDIYFDIELDEIAEDESLYPLMIEFAESVDEREQFTFDEYGTAETPDNPLTVILNQNYQRIRSDNGAPVWKFKFSLRVIP